MPQIKYYDRKATPRLLNGRRGTRRPNVDAQIINSGLYRVIVTNSAISTVQSNTTATVLVQAPPVITSFPQDLTVEPGSALALQVEAGGSALFYQWQFDGVDISGATNAILNLSNLSLADQGVYGVVATNFVGAAAASARLAVGVPEFLLRKVARQPDGSVRMLLVGSTNRNYVIEASANLTNWTTIGTVVPANGRMPFTDGSAGAATNRFYRARLAP